MYPPNADAAPNNTTDILLGPTRTNFAKDSGFVLLGKSREGERTPGLATICDLATNGDTKSEEENNHAGYGVKVYS